MASLRARLKDLFTPAERLTPEAFERLRGALAKHAQGSPPISSIDLQALNPRDWRQRYNLDGTPGGWIGHGARVSLDAQIEDGSIIDGRKLRVGPAVLVEGEGNLIINPNWKQPRVMRVDQAVIDGGSVLEGGEFKTVKVSHSRLQHVHAFKSSFEDHEGWSSHYFGALVHGGSTYIAKAFESTLEDTKMSYADAAYSRLVSSSLHSSTVDHADFKRVNAERTVLSDVAAANQEIDQGHGLDELDALRQQQWTASVGR